MLTRKNTVTYVEQNGSTTRPDRHGIRIPLILSPLNIIGTTVPTRPRNSVSTGVPEQQSANNMYICRGQVPEMLHHMDTFQFRPERLHIRMYDEH